MAKFNMTNALHKLNSKLFVEVGGCHLFQGPLTRGGYGCLGVNGRSWMTHRLAWRIHKGPIPNGLWVLHKCDVRNCCNPDHLWLGTAADNGADCKRKGRYASVVGENNPNARLTRIQARSIFLDPRPRLELAYLFGVGITAIDYIKTRKAWKEATADLVDQRRETIWQTL